MKPHEIERRQPQADRVEIVLSRPGAILVSRPFCRAAAATRRRTDRLGDALRHPPGAGWRFHDIQNVISVAAAAGRDRHAHPDMAGRRARP